MYLFWRVMCQSTRQRKKTFRTGWLSSLFVCVVLYCVNTPYIFMTSMMALQTASNCNGFPFENWEMCNIQCFFHSICWFMSNDSPVKSYLSVSRLPGVMLHKIRTQIELTTEKVVLHRVVTRSETKRFQLQEICLFTPNAKMGFDVKKHPIKTGFPVCTVSHTCNHCKWRM